MTHEQALRIAVEIVDKISPREKGQLTGFTRVREVFRAAEFLVAGDIPAVVGVSIGRIRVQVHAKEIRGEMVVTIIGAWRR